MQSSTFKIKGISDSQLKMVLCTDSETRLEGDRKLPVRSLVLSKRKSIANGFRKRIKAAKKPLTHAFYRIVFR